MLSRRYIRMKRVARSSIKGFVYIFPKTIRSYKDRKSYYYPFGSIRNAIVCAEITLNPFLQE